MMCYPIDTLHNQEQIKMAKTSKNNSDKEAKANQRKAGAAHKGGGVQYDTPANQKLGKGVPSPEVYGYAGGGLYILQQEFRDRAAAARERAEGAKSRNNMKKSQKFGLRSAGGR
jgi:hypothetical protein